jgi:predicted AAA+ superfamily ATPase
MTDYRDREISILLKRAMTLMPVIVVGGLRQTGKSTLLKNDARLAKGRTYLTLDDLDVFEQIRERPDAILSMPRKLALDEAQRLAELPLAIKRAVDRDRRPGRFVLSGSANPLLMARVTESLAGRAFYSTLHPMNRREISGTLDQPPALATFLQRGTWPDRGGSAVTESEVMRGGFPSLALHPGADAWMWFESYEKTYLERDIRDLRRVNDLVSLRRLVRLAALRTGGIVNLSDLARDAHLPRSTVVQHLDLLEAMYLIRRIPPYLGNRASRLIKSPKLYFADSGLAAHLAGLRELKANSTEPLWGPLLENYVLQNLAAALEPHLPGVRFHFWHEQGRHEVDFVLEWGRHVAAIEVKSRGRRQADDFKGLRVFMERTPQCRVGILACLEGELKQLEDKLWIVPLHRLLA